MGRNRLALVMGAYSRRVGVIFPGQGSQVVGMGVDVASQSVRATSLFERASAIVGYDMLALVREGPEERLRETRFSQPAIFVTNLALYEAAAPLEPLASAGHSFGELCSLTIAGALSFEDGVRLVHERALAMQAAAEMAPGGMSAILGIDVERLRGVVAEARRSGRVALANFNSPQQIVISGDLGAVEHAAALALEAGAKRVVSLNVSGAWHSELMIPARERFAPIVEATLIERPRLTVISNTDARPYDDPAQIKEHIIRSVTEEVRWHDAMLRLLEERLDLIVEFGASAVLTPLARRLPDAPQIMHVGDAAGVAKLREILREPTPAA